MELIKEEVTKCVDKTTLDGSDVNVDDLITCFRHQYPLDGLETEYLQVQCYREHFDYLVSLKIINLYNNP